MCFRCFSPVRDNAQHLLSTTFARKDGMLDWEWLGIDLFEWPPQRLEWEICRIEHLAFANYMESTMKEWLEAPWFVGYAAPRNMAALECSVSHPVCAVTGRNKNSGKTWSVMTGAMQHFLTSLLRLTAE